MRLWAVAILNPRAHPLSAPARLDARRTLELREDAFVVLALFGGQGAPELLPLARRLLSLEGSWTIIAVAGRNQRLERDLRSLARLAAGRLRVHGFSREIGLAMAASDVLLSKPGPATLAEAFHHQLPMVVPLNAFTIPQERFNARYLDGHGLGVVVGSWREMASAAFDLRRDLARLSAMRRRLQRLPENRAVDEVLDEITSAATGV